MGDSCAHLPPRLLQCLLGDRHHHGDAGQEVLPSTSSVSSLPDDTMGDTFPLRPDLRKVLLPRLPWQGMETLKRESYPIGRGLGVGFPNNPHLVCHFHKTGQTAFQPSD